MQITTEQAELVLQTSILKAPNSEFQFALQSSIREAT
jgi:hypothetical protein